MDILDHWYGGWETAMINRVNLTVEKLLSVIDIDFQTIYANLCGISDVFCFSITADR